MTSFFSFFVLSFCGSEPEVEARATMEVYYLYSSYGFGKGDIGQLFISLLVLVLQCCLEPLLDLWLINSEKLVSLNFMFLCDQMRALF